MRLRYFNVVGSSGEGVDEALQAGSARARESARPVADERFRAVVDDINDLVVVLGDTGAVEFANEAVSRSLGYDLNEIVGRHFSELIDLAVHDDWEKVFGEVLALPGSHGPFEMQVPDVGGGMHRLRMLVTNRREVADGWGIVVIARDETERLEAQRLFEENQAWWQALLRLGSELILVLDEEGAIQYATPAIESILGFTPDEVVGTSAFDYIHPNDLAHAAADFVRRFEEGGPTFRTHFRARTTSGGWRNLATYGLDVRAMPGRGSMVVNARDVTAEVEAERALRNSEQRFKAMVQHSSDIIVLADARGNITYASPAIERVLGYVSSPPGTPDQVIDAIHPDDVEAGSRLLRWALSNVGLSDPVPLRIRSADSSWRILEFVGQNLLDDPAVGAMVFNGRDVTDRHLAERLLVGQATVLEGVAQGAPLQDTLRQIANLVEEQIAGARAVVTLVDASGALRFVDAPSLPDQLLAALDHHPVDSPLGAEVRQMRPVVFSDVASDLRWVALRKEMASAGLYACWSWPLTSADDTDQLGTLAVFLPRTGSPTVDQEVVCQRAAHLAAIAVERRRVEDLLEHRAVHDLLTGLPNRTLLVDRIEQALARGRRSSTDLAVLFVDVDDFKTVNDSLGHGAGDDLLLQIGQRFARLLRPGDTVGRFGGDEFVLVSDEVGGEAGALQLAENLLDSLRQPFDLGGTAVVASASVGIAYADTSTVNSAELIRNADAAMYRAKELGRGSHVVFEQGMHDRVVERFQLESDLRRTIAEGGFQLWYQPIVRISDGQVVGLEALLRWNRPGHGLVMPTFFIPTAEETGLIVPIGKWVLGEVCRQLAEWSTDEALSQLRVSANLSARQLSDPHLQPTLLEQLRTHAVDPAKLTLEVTESVLVADVQAASQILTSLDELGVAISIDDFGTGYSSLDYVRRFTVADELKIDRTFVADLEHEGAVDEAIVSASIVLARALGLRVVAEGVETDLQLDALRRLGCDFAQGYLFSRPVPAKEVAELVRQGV